MSRSMRQVAAAAAGVGALVISGATPALAANSNGAVVDKFNDCTDYGFAEVCNNIHTVTNTTETPSGNANYIAHGKYDYTVTYEDGYTYSGSGKFHSKTLVKKGELHVFHGRASDTYTSPFGTCTYEFAYHYANGQWQYEDFDYTCD